MPTNNPFPLNIPSKVNSPELLAFFQQFGIDKYLSAEEINKMSTALQYLYENMGGSPGALPDLVLSVGTLTDIGDEEFEFGEGYTWRLAGTVTGNEAPVTLTINTAPEGFYRIDVAYGNADGQILIQEGLESDDVAVEPSIPAGTIKLRTFTIFGDVVSIGGGVPLPFDMSVLDELLELDPEAYIWMNINGLDVRGQVQLLVDYLTAIATDIVNSLNYLDLKILASPPATPTANTIRLYSVANTVTAVFPDGQSMSFVKNTSQNGVVTLPFHSGRMETHRPIANITPGPIYSIQESDASRCLRASGTINLDFQLGTSMLGTPEFQFVNNSSGTVRITTQGVIRINGSFSPIVLQPNFIYRMKRVATNDFVVNLPGATPSWGSITGALSTQTDLINALNLKANLQNVKQYIISKPIGNYGSHSGDTLETVILSVPFAGGDYEFGDYLGFNIWTNKIGTAGITSLQVRIGTTGTTADSVLTILQQHTTGQSSAASKRDAILFEAGNFINGRTRPTVSASSIDYGSFVNPAKLTLNPANPWFLTFTATHANASDSISVTTYQITKIKSF